jgi:hypothetical protein
VHRLQRKFILIGIISVLVIALVAVFAVPAVAAGFPWGPKAGVNKNVTVVHGTITGLTSTSITITEADGTSVTLALDSSTNFNIHGTDWIGSADLSGKPVTAVYKHGQTGVPVAGQVMIDMPEAAPKIANPPAIKNFASVQGSLSVNPDGTITITITPGSTISPDLNASSDQTVTIIYNSSSNNVIKGLILNRPGQPDLTPKGLPNVNIATVQGSMTVDSGGNIVITPTGGVTLSIPSSGLKVNIIYNSSTGTVEGLMMPRLGQGFSGTPKSAPFRFGHNRPGGQGI